METLSTKIYNEALKAIGDCTYMSKDIVIEVYHEGQLRTFTAHIYANIMAKGEASADPTLLPDVDIDIEISDIKEVLEDGREVSFNYE